MAFTIRSRGGDRPHLPVQLLEGTQTTTDLEAVVEASRSVEEHGHMWEPGQERPGPYFIPPFQRPPVWTEEQKERFVESAHLGIGLGSIVVVDALNLPMRNQDLFALTDRWLLDGRQRVGAVIDYHQDRLTVFRGTECEHRWSDLNTVERRRFLRTQIGVLKIATDDVDFCREVYDRMNFGGTPHTQDERAIIA